MKKGFTLIELLAVIILLAVIALIAYPTLNNVISKNKDKLYDKQIEELKRHTNTWIMGNAETFELEVGETYLLSFEELYKFGLLDSKEVKDPRNSENLPGCMVISRNSINYNIRYNEECKAPKKCTYSGELVQGAEFVDGQYTYRYMQHSLSIIDLGMVGSGEPSKVLTTWKNIEDGGWGVTLTDKLSTDPVTTEVCSTINDKPIVNMQHMFYGSKASSIDLSNFDTSNVVDMQGMFLNTNTTSLDLSSFDTTNVTDMADMFCGSKAITLDLSSFDTSNVTNMSGMFAGSQAKTINLSSFNTSNVTNMSYMFRDSQATALDVSKFDTSKVTDMSCMFSDSQATTLDLSGFDTSNVTTMYSMFSDSQTKTINLSSFNTSNVTDMFHMFKNSQATSLDLSSFDTIKVTNVASMFQNAATTTGYARTQADADKFNNKKVTDIPDTLTFVVK